MFKPRKLQAIKAGFDDEKIAFYPRMASLAEREEVDKQISEARAETLDKHQRIYDVKVEAIANWSSEPPKKLENVKGEFKLKPLVEGVENTSDAMNQFFKQRSAENEEVINGVFAAYLSLMSASVDFL